MLTQPTIEKLCAMRLRGMAEAFREQQENAEVQRLSFEERLGLLIDRQWNWRENRALERRLRNARLQGPACVEDIDYRTPRGLDRQLVRSLVAESVWVREHQNLFLLGPTGIGKTWLGRAFAQKACRDGYTAYFAKASELFAELAMARADGSHRKLLYRLSRVDVLVVDDWAMALLTESERRDFLEIIDERYQARSTLLTSQLPVAAWHAQSAIQPRPTVFSTGSCTTRTGSSCRANPCGKSAAESIARRRSERTGNAVEMPDGGKPGKPKAGFPPFPPSLEIAAAIPTFPHA